MATERVGAAAAGIVRRKRDRQRLADGEIAAFVLGVVATRSASR